MRIRRVLKWTAIAVPVGMLALLGIGYVRSTNACDRPNPTAPATPMKAVIYCEYGSGDVLHFENIEKPKPGPHDVLVRVRAVALNPLDWHFMRGMPYVGRVSFGLKKPKAIRIGVDFAGTVEAVGDSVTKFKQGDEVFGGKGGAAAEYITVHEDRGIATKPANISFDEAAGINVAAITSLQALRDKGQLKPGQRVLINGASGGVGTYMVQIAKVLGAHVTAVNSTRNIELVKSLGADTVIDYTKDDYTRGSQRYDLIVDNVGNRGLGENRRVLTPNGRYVLIGGGGVNDNRWLGPLPRLIGMFVSSPFVSQDAGMMLAETKQHDLQTLAGLIQSGKVKPVIDKRYTMPNIGEAITYLEQGRARGKVVVSWE